MLKSYRRDPTDEIKRAEIWVERQFEKKSSHLLEETLKNPTLLDADRISILIGKYTGEIGDLERALAGEENTLDEYLRRDSREEN